MTGRVPAWLALAALVLSSFAPLRVLGADTAKALAEPALSPDGSEIAFVSGGDIWVAPGNGGVAHLLISNGAANARPMYAPDGKHLAFSSTRTGHADLYALDFADGNVRQLTHDDGFAQTAGRVTAPAYTSIPSRTRSASRRASWKCRRPAERR